MDYLEIGEVAILQENILKRTGGSQGIREISGLESALELPKMTAFGQDLYPTLVEKAAILGFALVSNHPFMDGNKRIGHAAMEVFLKLNGYEIGCPVDEQEQIILQMADGKLDKEAFTNWLKSRIKPINF